MDLGTFASMKLTVSKLSRICWLSFFFYSEMCKAIQELIFDSRTAALSPSSSSSSPLVALSSDRAHLWGFLSVVSPYGDSRVTVVLEFAR